MKTNNLTYCSMLTSLVIALEIVAALSGETLVFITVFSALPIYLLTRNNIKYGLLSYGVVTILLGIVNFHQVLFFVFSNGLIGLCLGISCNLGIKKYWAPIITAVVTTGGLNILSMVLGIYFFKLFGSFLLLNEFIICMLLIVYCSIYLWFANFIYKRIGGYLTF